MRIILCGYEGSRKIRPISKALLEKYAPFFELDFIEHTGEIGAWSLFVRKYLESIEDEYIIFTLDDYLISRPVDMKRFADSLDCLVYNIACVRLCSSEKDGIQNEYTVVAQYCIWDRQELINVLKKTSTPWDFEITGTKIFKKNTYGFKKPIFEYSDCSALSSRHPDKINVEGLSDEDIKLVLEHYDEDDLIIGLPYGKEPIKWKS